MLRIIFPFIVFIFLSGFSTPPPKITLPKDPNKMEKQVFRWREKEGLLSHYLVVRDGIYMPYETKVINKKPPTLNFYQIPAGLVYLLSESEKKRLPLSILKRIYSHKAFFDNQKREKNYYVVAFAEIYPAMEGFLKKAQEASFKGKGEVLFMAVCLTSPSDEFYHKNLNNFEWHLFPTISMHYLFFYLDSEGEYHFIESGAAG